MGAVPEFDDTTASVTLQTSFAAEVPKVLLDSFTMHTRCYNLVRELMKLFNQACYKARCPRG
jgi:hypothetical protein